MDTRAGSEFLRTVFLGFPSGGEAGILADSRLDFLQTMVLAHPTELAALSQPQPLWQICGIQCHWCLIPTAKLLWGGWGFRVPREACFPTETSAHESLAPHQYLLTGFIKPHSLGTF